MSSPAARSEQTPRLADRLAAARRGRFVGRAAELELFRRALLADPPPFVVLYLHGPGGVGKTSLLREYARVAVDCDRPIVHVDGRNIQSSPPGFLSAMSYALGLEAESRAPWSHWPQNGVLLIDTYEALTSLDAWLRETCLPQLPAQSMVVIAGRDPPAPAWRTEIDWSALTRIVLLQNLRPEESETYLATRGIDPAHYAQVLAFTHGHPLALSLVADVFAQHDTPTTFDPQTDPDVVRILLERFLRDVPTPQHREALRICALARTTTEALLQAFLNIAAHDLFEWLRRLSFIEHSPYGLFPHDLARVVLNADFRWRNLEDYHQVGRRVHVYLRSRLPRAKPREQQQLQLDILFALRNNPAVGPFFDWNAMEGVYAEPAAPADAEVILNMVRAHEGEASAQIAQHWWNRQRGAFLVFRNVEGECLGFMAHLALHHTTTEDGAPDPAVQSALEFIRRFGPMRQGETSLHLRFWMHREAYQTVTAAINLAAMNTLEAVTRQSALAWNFTTMADPDFWQPHFSGLNWMRAPDADFEVGGRRYGVFAHDWRVGPLSDWLMGIYQPMPFAGAEQRKLPPGPAPVLSQTEFAEAARQALRDYTRPDLLATNPLLRSRLIAGDPSPAKLQAVLREAAAALTGNPKDRKLHRALWHTFFEPAPTQEQAAELINVPFSTYRYHLTQGLARLTAWLWRREFNEP
jgi:hypothetical protein